jgi:hypothetical protein
MLEGIIRLFSWELSFRFIGFCFCSQLIVIKFGQAKKYDPEELVVHTVHTFKPENEEAF